MSTRAFRNSEGKYVEVGPPAAPGRLLKFTADSSAVRVEAYAV